VSEFLMLDVSVIVCTRNRARQLAGMLDSACSLAVPADVEWELLIIDNGSHDETPEVVRRYAHRLPLRCVVEPIAGLSHARNRGVDEARGRYICWTDDDVLLESNWLRAYVAAFRRHPEAAVFGGRILPELEPPAPAWFDRGKHRWPLACPACHTDMGDTIIPIAANGRIPWGANFAIRAAEQKRHRYNVAIGVSPAHRRIGEETDLIYRVMKAGGTGWWVPDSRIRHILPAARQTRRSILRYFEQAGQTAAYLHDMFPGDNANERDGAPAMAALATPALWWRLIAHRLVASAAWLVGARDIGLYSLARFGLYLGVANHRRHHGRAKAGALAMREGLG
jgi:glycosyltransferase involved in cell wall biosynthesis